MKKKIVFWASLATIIDQLTKFLIKKNFRLYEKKVIITSGDGVEINFYFIKNADAKPSLYSASQMYTNPYFDM